MSEYHGRHEPGAEATVGLDEILSPRDEPDRADPLPDATNVLREARNWMGAWEQADPKSADEHRAGLELTERFAVLDLEAMRGNLPQPWQQPASGPAWTPYQLSLVALFGTCVSCGGPRAARFATDGPDGIKQVMYCTICGSEEQ